MNIIKYIQKHKGDSYKKGSHRKLNYTVTGNKIPTTHQAAMGKWKDKGNKQCSQK